MNSSTIRTDGRLKQMPVMCMEAIKIFKENNCWDIVKPIAYRQFYNCSVNMFFQTETQYQKAHFEELVKLFADFDNKCAFGFKKKELRVINMIRKNDFKRMRRFTQRFKFFLAIRKARQKFVSIRWNKEEHRILLFGHNLSILNNSGIANAK